MTFPRQVAGAFGPKSVRWFRHYNRLVRRALRARGYPAALHKVPDMHNYTAWRDAFDPHLTQLIRQVCQ